MTRVNEEVCCGGCTPRAGTLVLLLLTSVFCIVSIVNDILFFTQNTPDANEYLILGLFSKSVFIFIYKISVLVIAVAGLYGLTQERPKFLLLFYYYNCFQVIVILVIIFCLIIDPPSTVKYFGSTASPTYIELYDTQIFLSFLLFFGLMLQVYFFVVVKSQYETMLDQYDYEVMNQDGILLRTFYADQL